MNAYMDAARRVDYPEGLLNLTSTDHIEEALASLDSPVERGCLQRVARGWSESRLWEAVFNIDHSRLQSREMLFSPGVYGFERNSRKFVEHHHESSLQKLLIVLRLDRYKIVQVSSISNK